MADGGEQTGAGLNSLCVADGLHTQQQGEGKIILQVGKGFHGQQSGLRHRGLPFSLILLLNRLRAGSFRDGLLGCPCLTFRTAIFRWVQARIPSPTATTNAAPTPIKVIRCRLVASSRLLRMNSVCRAVGWGSFPAPPASQVSASLRSAPRSSAPRSRSFLSQSRARFWKRVCPLTQDWSTVMAVTRSSMASANFSPASSKKIQFRTENSLGTFSASISLMTIGIRRLLCFAAWAISSPQISEASEVSLIMNRKASAPSMAS